MTVMALHDVAVAVMGKSTYLGLGLITVQVMGNCTYLGVGFSLGIQYQIVQYHFGLWISRFWIQYHFQFWIQIQFWGLFSLELQVIIMLSYIILNFP